MEDIPNSDAMEGPSNMNDSGTFRKSEVIGLWYRQAQNGLESSVATLGDGERGEE